MAYVLDQTGVIGRLVNILNSLIGWLPGGSGYVATIGSALFGMISGVASASAASIGSVTIPWMQKTGWSKERSAAIVAGNGGLGNVFPPSSVMLLVLGIDAVAAEVTSSQLYVGLFGVGAIVLVVRLLLVFIFAKQEGLKAVPKEDIMPLGQSLKENGSALIIFLGILIPLLVTMFGTGDWFKARLAGTEDAFSSISLIFWIPILITFFAIVEGWKYLPHDFSGWSKICTNSISRFSDLGALLFCAFLSSRLLTKLGMSDEFSALFTALKENGASAAVIIFAIVIIITAMVGPFNATATTSAMCAVCYMAMRSIGIPPVTAAVAFINLVSNQSCIPPNSAPIYISCGIANVEEPVKIFKDLVLYYALPQIVIVLLVMFQIIPVIGA
jgi:TRAP-type C4-dicarboxylate transport system permease large subunit